MNDIIKIFETEEFGPVRVIMIDGKPWFVGKDIATNLGYKNTRVALKDNVDEEDKVVTEVTTPGGLQKAVLINESGMYALVFNSRLESAKQFKHWVTSEILPTLRKTGTYTMPGYEPDYESGISPELQWFARQDRDTRQDILRYKEIDLASKTTSTQYEAQQEPHQAAYTNTWQSDTDTPVYNCDPADFIPMAEQKGDAVMAHRRLRNRKKGLSAIYSHMTDYGVDWGAIKHQSQNHGCCDGDCVLVQLSVLPEYYPVFFQSAHDLLQ